MCAIRGPQPSNDLPLNSHRVIGVIRGRPTSVSDIRDVGELGAVQLTSGLDIEKPRR